MLGDGGLWIMNNHRGFTLIELMIALVLGVMAASILLGSILKVLGLISTKMGCAPK